MGPNEQDHVQPRTLCGPSQHGGRHGVASLSACQQLASRPEPLQFPDANSGTLCDRSVCRQIEESASAILQLAWNQPSCLIMRFLLKFLALLPDHALLS